MIVTKGATDVSVYYYIRQDASATSPGEPVTGLLFSDIETGGSASYVRQGAVRVDLTLITLASASATHADGGFILVDDTNMPGLYRCDYPDATFVTGVDVVTLQIVVEGTNNAVADPIFVQLTGADLQATTDLGLSNLDATVSSRMAEASIDTTGGTVDSVTLVATTTAVTNQVTADVTSISGDTPAADNLEADYDGTGFTKAASTIGTCTTNTDMRGTDDALLAANINLSSGVVESNLLQMGGVVQSATDLKDFADEGYDPATNKVQGVALVDTTTVNSDMRGTNSALLASDDGSGLVEAGGTGDQLTAIDLPNQTMDITGNITGNLSGSVGSVTAINTTGGAIDDVVLVATTTTNSDMRGTDSALLAVSAPTNFGDLAITVTTGLVSVGTNNDKTGYSISGSITTLDGLNNFDPGSDAVANVTLVATTTTNTDAITVADILTTQMTEAYAADGVAPTLTQSLFLIQQILTDFGITGTTLTVREIDGATTAATLTLDDDTNPTDLTRTT